MRLRCFVFFTRAVIPLVVSNWNFPPLFLPLCLKFWDMHETGNGIAPQMSCSAHIPLCFSFHTSHHLGLGDSPPILFYFLLSFSWVQVCVISHAHPPTTATISFLHYFISFSFPSGHLHCLPKASKLPGSRRLLFSLLRFNTFSIHLLNTIFHPKLWRTLKETITEPLYWLPGKGEHPSIQNFKLCVTIEPQRSAVWWGRFFGNS